MDNQIINCRCGRERRNKESNLSGLNNNKVLTDYAIKGKLIKPIVTLKWPRG